MVFNFFLFFLKKYRSIRIRLLGKDARIVKIKNGLLMKIDPSSETDQTFYFGNYERALLHFIREFVQPGDTCLDIGSHKGYFTMQLSRQTGAKGAVHAFDPDPNAFRILTENCKLNRLSNVYLNNLALADKKGQCEFFLNNYLGHSSRFPNKYAAPNIAKSIIVQTLPLDEYLNQPTMSLQEISFIKIDAEGSEQLIISGMQESIKRFKPAIHMEINYLSLREAKADNTFFTDFFKKNNYKVFWIDFYRDKFLKTHYTFRELKEIFDVTGQDMIDIVAIDPSSQYWERFKRIKEKAG